MIDRIDVFPASQFPISNTWSIIQIAFPNFATGAVLHV